MIGALVVLGKAWKQIHRARGDLVTDGLYRYARHPQYAALFLFTFGLLVQWPTIATLLMWPVLVATYLRLPTITLEPCAEGGLLWTTM